MASINTLNVKSRKKTFGKWYILWLSIDRRSGRILDFEIGDHKPSTDNKLWKRLEKKYYNIQIVYTDGNSSYFLFLPKEKHIISKKHTQKIEARNSRIHAELKKCVRKANAISKCPKMLVLSMFIYQHRHIMWNYEEYGITYF